MPLTGDWVRRGRTIVVLDPDGDFLEGELETPVQAAANAAATAFVRRNPKIAGTAESLRGLTEIFRRTKSGGRAYTPREGKYLPVHTRAAAAELKTLLGLAARPDVARIEVVPSRSGQRSPDFLIHRKDGTVNRTEVTTLTGGGRGYQDTGAGGKATADAGAIERAVRRKIGPTSQLAVGLPGVPAGGTLVVHVPRGGPTAPQSVQAAMRALKADIEALDYLRAIQFVLPDGGGATYRRTAAKTYEPA